MKILQRMKYRKESGPWSERFLSHFTLNVFLQSRPGGFCFDSLHLFARFVVRRKPRKSYSEAWRAQNRSYLQLPRQFNFSYDVAWSDVINVSPRFVVDVFVASQPVSAQFFFCPPLKFASPPPPSSQIFLSTRIKAEENVALFFFMRVTFPSPKTPRLSARAVPTVLNEANFTLRWTIHVEKSTKEFSYWLEEKRSRCKAPNVMTFLTVDSVSAALLQTDCAADKLNYISIYYLYIYYLSVWFSASFLYFYTTDI